MDVDSKIINLINRSPIDKKTKDFLAIYLKYGFGTLQKNDINILIYHFLKDLDLLNNLSIHEKSDLLSITESKIKSLEVAAYLKFSNKDEHQYIDEFIQKLKNDQIKIEYENEKIRFQLNDPILKRIIENLFIKKGIILDYSFNKDIFSLKLLSFMNFINQSDMQKYEEIKNKILGILRKVHLNDKDLHDKIKRESNLESVLKLIATTANLVTPGFGEILKIVFEYLKSY